MRTGSNFAITIFSTLIIREFDFYSKIRQNRHYVHCCPINIDFISYLNLGLFAPFQYRSCRSWGPRSLEWLSLNGHVKNKVIWANRASSTSLLELRFKLYDIGKELSQNMDFPKWLSPYGEKIPHQTINHADRRGRTYRIFLDSRWEW